MASGNVTINTKPPEFVTDYGTEYLALESQLDGRKLNKTDDTGVKTRYRFSKATRTIALEFKDDVGLDYRQVALYVGDTCPKFDGSTKGLTDDIIYYYDRTLGESLRQDYVEKMSFAATRDGRYRVEFQLNELWAVEDSETGEHTDLHSILDVIDTDDFDTITYMKDGETVTRRKRTKSRLNLIVWDLSGNYSIYQMTRPFDTLALDDLNDLSPVEIEFTDIEPESRCIEDGVEGKITTRVYDPNDVLWEYENIAQLTENSIGAIDLGSYEAGDNRIEPLTGVREFIVTHLTESGQVEVEAWVETGFPAIDELVKEKTYNIATCGPWVFEDEGRKYDIARYVPKYLHGTEFADFIEFFQLYINSMYQSLESRRNISCLEKIARIGNFNDISRLEDSLVYHYARQFGNEFDFDAESLKNVNLTFNGVEFNTKDIDETYDIIKYVLGELPVYNRYKGTNTGLTMAIRMFRVRLQSGERVGQKERDCGKRPKLPGRG